MDIKTPDQVLVIVYKLTSRHCQNRYGEHNEVPKVFFQRRRDNGICCIPGGGINDGEDTLDAAVREAYEENRILIPSEAYRHFATMTLSRGNRLFVFASEAEDDFGFKRRTEESIEAGFCLPEDWRDLLRAKDGPQITWLSFLLAEMLVNWLPMRQGPLEYECVPQVVSSRLGPGATFWRSEYFT